MHNIYSIIQLLLLLANKLLCLIVILLIATFMSPLSTYPTMPFLHDNTHVPIPLSDPIIDSNNTKGSSITITSITNDISAITITVSFSSHNHRHYCMVWYEHSSSFLQSPFTRHDHDYHHHHDHRQFYSYHKKISDIHLAIL